MPKSPLTEETNLTSFTILSNGKEIPDTYEVISIRVEQNVNKITIAEILLRDGNSTNQTFDVTESDTFKPGAEIEIKLGYHSKDDSIFKGIAIKQLIKINSKSGSSLRVICKDKALKMTINKNNAIFEKQTDSSIISKIAGDNGLKTGVTSTSEEHKEIVQYYATDWDFIVTRAEINGMIVITDNGKLIVAKPDVNSSPLLQVQFGYDIIEFDGEIDATNQYSETKGTAWDISSQSVIEALGKEPSVNAQGDIDGKTLSGILSAGSNNLNSSTDISKNDIQNWADSALLKSRLSRFKGTVTFQGSALAKINSTIKLIGMSSRFDGNAFISGVIHTVENGNWHTEAKIGLSADWFSESREKSTLPASGLLPGVKGLQTGIVKKTYEDPDNQFRVKVEIPILGAENKTIWARLSTFYAGNNVGAYFMPEVEDEVILGFMNNDPRFPIILGSLFSSSIPAPETPDENNTIKTLITQSKLQLKFDDENKVLSILTPGGNTMVFNDENKAITIIDENDNKIEMNSEGISLESPRNISIKASQDVIIQGMNVSITGDQSVSASAEEVSIKGDVSTSIKGGAECSISSDGNLSAKGLMVMIN